MAVNLQLKKTSSAAQLEADPDNDKDQANPEEWSSFLKTRHIEQFPRTIGGNEGLRRVLLARARIFGKVKPQFFEELISTRVLMNLIDRNDRHLKSRLPRRRKHTMLQNAIPD